ncbi:MAG TPA: hypothetical protein VLJ84_05480 [Usitatibacter sp.]|nr:hypothetical protein [Usitatibacter sp.]
MNGTRVLEQRRTLIVLSTRLQRASLALRIARIEAHPAHALAGSAAFLLRSAWARRALFAMLGFALRTAGARSRRR